MEQFHFTPEHYLASMLEEIPNYERLEDETARATAGIEAREILELGTGTGETARRVLALHPQARLTGIDVKTVLTNRFDVGLDLARQLLATVLLKGSPTVIFTPGGDRYVVPRGTAALGTGGSGDLLDGIAGTMVAQTQDATIAACCAAWVHGRAAEFCQYVRGTTLDDVLYSLPRAWNEVEPLPEHPVLAELPAVAR